MAVRILRFEVYRIAGDPKETRQRWHELARQCQEIVNHIWQQWLVWHIQNGSKAKIKKHLDALARWRAGDKTTPKPKLDLQAIPKALSKLIYAGIAKEFPDVNTRTWGLIQNATAKKIKQRKAASGPLSGWMAILLNHENIPSSNHPQPIPFDRANSSGGPIPPATDKDNFRLRLRLDRVSTNGKMATSTVNEIELLTKRKGIAGHQAILWRICKGEYKFAGSSLWWDNKNKKWFALICYQREHESPKTDPDRFAFLRAADSHPWLLRSGSRRTWCGGGGRQIAAARQRLLTDRWSYQDNYHYSGSANQGHGRNRALGPYFKLSKGWKDFTKTTNHQLTREVVEKCVLDGVGTLVYFQPAGDAKKTSRFLTQAGKVPGRQDSTGWDWHQVGAMLAYKCQEVGIKLMIRKSGERRVGQRQEEPTLVHAPCA